MNLDKEREAFERHKNNQALVKLVDFDNGVYVAKLSGTWHEMARSERAAQQLNNDLAVWQAAKASDVQDGSLVIKDFETAKWLMEQINGEPEGNKKLKDALVKYKAMIEAAQEK